MANWKPENAVLTDLGLTMLSQAQVGLGTMIVTRVGVRSTYNSIENNRKMDLNTALSGIKLWGDIYKPKEGINPDGGVLDPDKDETSNADASLIRVRFSNENVTQSIGNVQVRQVVVFMKLVNLAEGVEDLGEVPYMVAQSEATSEKDDFDLLPTFDSNPTIINYDLYIVHSGVASIQVSINKDGYVTEEKHDADITEIWNVINSIKTNNVGQNTEELTFKLWKPVYDPDSRDWSREDSLLSDRKGTKTAERFNLYKTPETSSDPYADNIALGTCSHVEGENNLSTADVSHVEGCCNYAGYSPDDSVGDASFNANYGTHVEGSYNSAFSGWTQHIEGTQNVGTGYCSHIEGKKNQNSGSMCHVEGAQNKIDGGETNHVGGTQNTLSNSNATTVSGKTNTVVGCTASSISGVSNTVVSSNSSFVSGDTNNVISSPNSFVGGDHNEVNSSTRTYAIGYNNNVTLSCDFTFVSGSENSVHHSDGASVFGKKNTVDYTNESIISGYSNTTNKGVTRSLVLGKSNTLTKDEYNESYSSILTGESNVSCDSHSSVVSGSSNDVQQSDESIVSGNNNTIERPAYEGSKSRTYGIGRSIVTGINNTVSHTTNSVIFGDTNSVHDYRPNNIPGERMRSTNNLVSGEANDLKGFYSSIVTGKANDITNVHDSIIGGKENVITSDVSDSGTACVLCVGRANTVTNNGTPMTAFGSNNAISGNNAAVFGYHNIASGNEQTVMGKYNVEDTENKYAVLVGGGSNEENRKNIFALDWSGNLHISNIYTGGIKNEDGSDFDFSSGLDLDGITNGTGTNSIVLGNTSANVASAENAVAMGNATEASGTNAVAMGSDTRASGNQSCAIGQASEALADYAFAAGNLSKAHGQNTAVFNYNNTADTNSAGSFVCGTNNVANTDIGSLISGDTNHNDNTVNCFTSGKNNTVQYSQYSAVFGNQNTVDDSDNCIVSGTSCGSHNNSDRNIINGYQSHAYANSSNNILSGNSIHITSTNNSLVTGNKGTTVQNTDSSLVVANSTSVNHSEGSIIIGSSNTVGPDSYYGNTFDNTGVTFSGNTVVGDNNLLRSAKSQVFGRNHFVSGASNFVAGFSNLIGYYFGNPSNPSDTIKYQTNNIVLGSNNNSYGANNVLIGEGLNDSTNLTGSFPDYSHDNPATYSADGSVILGKFNLHNAAILNNRFFIIGCGTDEINNSANALSINNTGQVYVNNTINTTGADVSEWFEWEDSNTNSDDRRGLFVTLVGDKIAVADENTKYVHGIVSARPALVGNSYEDEWNKKYLTDVFGEIIYEDKLIPAVTETVTNEDGEEVEVIVKPERTVKAPVINPDYDPSMVYVPRSERPEWSYVSCCGRLVVVDDGTCQPNGYCRPTSGGIATSSSETGFRVMKRIDDTHILVWTNGAVTFE